MGIQYNQLFDSIIYTNSIQPHKSSHSPTTLSLPTAHSRWSAADVTTAPAFALRKLPALAESSPRFSAPARRLSPRTSSPLQHVLAESARKTPATAAAREQRLIQPRDRLHHQEI